MACRMVIISFEDTFFFFWMCLYFINTSELPTLIDQYKPPSNDQISLKLKLFNTKIKSSYRYLSILKLRNIKLFLCKRIKNLTSENFNPVCPNVIIGS